MHRQLGGSSALLWSPITLLDDAVDSGAMDLEVFSNLLHLLTISEGFPDFCVDEAFFPLSSHDFN